MTGLLAPDAAGAAERGTGSPRAHTVLDDVAHLTPATLARAQRHLVAKALAEFAHERLVAPLADPGPSGDGDGRATSPYRLEVDGGRVVYRFRARRLPLEHWSIDHATLHRSIDGRTAELDVQQLVLELQPALQVPDDLLALYLEELSGTLASHAFKQHRGGPTAAELVGAPLGTVEAAMTEGHPGFLANNGRIGLGVREHAVFSPEAARPLRLVWLAARRDRSHLALGAGVDPDELVREQLGACRGVFEQRLREQGLDPLDYHVLPVHPWQWEHRVAVTFAPDLARHDLVLLGEGDDPYLPQQSVRTLLHATDPSRDYVKTAMAIQNMGFLRGLSPEYMLATPAISDWVADLVEGDETLRDCGFRVLREHASIGYTGDVYHRAPQGGPHRKMVSALWRQSPCGRVRPGQALATMASLLHRDHRGDSYLGALVRAAGLTPADWVRAYLRVYLRPLVHCLVRHDLAFMPHGENMILVLEQSVPVGVFAKDIGEEVTLLHDTEVPPGVERIIDPVEGRCRAAVIFTDVFDGVLRHLCAVLVQDALLDAGTFWALVAECLDTWCGDHPRLAAVTPVDLRVPRFTHSCLNRLQLRNTRQMVDLADQTASLIRVGTLANPVGRAGAVRPAPDD